MGESGESWPIWQIPLGTQGWGGGICRVISSGRRRHEETETDQEKR
jgi:hypothetical protein